MTEPGDFRSLPSFRAEVSDVAQPSPELLAPLSGRVPLDICNPLDDLGRRWWNVRATKIAYADRNVARRVMGDDRAAADRGFMPIGSASVTADDDEQFPVGCPTAYCLRLTDAEAEQFRAASNAIEVVLDGAQYPDRAAEEGPRFPNG